MRAYRLHDRAWTRIVTHRVRRPDLIAARLASRRKRAHVVPVDGQLVLLAGNHGRDPRSGQPVDRRELLDRLVEALSVPEVDGVVASADLLEELTVLNVLEDRVAVLSSRPAIGVHDHWFDGVHLQATGWTPEAVTADIAAWQSRGLPTLVELRMFDFVEGSALDVDWREWSDPLRAIASSVATGPGVWFLLPAIAGMDALAEQVGFPLLMWDNDRPIDPGEWQSWFEHELPLTVRGIVAGPSALFPSSGSVAEATERIATAVRQRVT